MKVDRLYIVCIGCGVVFPLGTDTEIRPGGLGLYNKYTKQRQMSPAKVSLIEVSGDPAQPSIELKGGPALVAEKDLTERVGVYVFGHGSTRGKRKLGDMEPEQVADMLSKGLNLKRLDKLCVVSCTIGADEVRPQVDGDVSFLKVLCVELALKGLTPMVAGYDGFVTVAFPDMNPKNAPHANKNNKHVVDERMEGKKVRQLPSGIQGAGSLAGKKILVRDDVARQPEIAIRKHFREHKFVWQVVGNKLVPMQEGWSDKMK